MNILFISRQLGYSGCFNLGRRSVVALVLAFVIALPAAALYAGYRLGFSHARTSVLLSNGIQSELDSQRVAIANAKRVADDNLNALALRLGQMQARMMRLDALGQRLTQMAGLDKGEFNFNNVPGEGGPEDPADTRSLRVPDFISMFDQLSKEIDDRSSQLGVLETMLLNRNLQAEVIPSGRPVRHGWISSTFGMRTDPFTGRLEHHNGIDFAGKEGSPILAVAAGVVTWAGPRFGYGNLVEINHGKGYATRYGHNEKILVKVGETVKKGQVIALMGSTGRSTGPHCHFEVLINGRAVNPAKYIQASR